MKYPTKITITIEEDHEADSPHRALTNAEDEAVKKIKPLFPNATIKATAKHKKDS